jgi:transposase
VDEIEAAGQVPPRVHARKAKRRLGRVNKTDKLDARGLNRLQRDLPRPRRVLTRERTRLTNRLPAPLAKVRPAPGGDE